MTVVIEISSFRDVAAAFVFVLDLPARKLLHHSLPPRGPKHFLFHRTTSRRDGV